MGKSIFFSTLVLALSIIAIVSLLSASSIFYNQYKYYISYNGTIDFIPFFSKNKYNISINSIISFNSLDKVYKYIINIISDLVLSNYTSVYRYSISTDDVSFIVYNDSVIKNGEIYLSPEHDWYDCSFIYRDVVLVFLNSTQSVFFVFNSSSYLFMNLTSGSGVRVVVFGNSSVYEPLFALSLYNDYVLINVSFSDVNENDFYYVDFYYGGSVFYNSSYVDATLNSSDLLFKSNVITQRAPVSCFLTTTSSAVWTWSPPQPPSINVSITSPSVMISSPGIYDPVAILSLFVFLAIFIAYNKIARTGQALAVSAAISLMIAMVSQNPYLIVLYTLLFAVGMAMWKTMH